MVGLTVISLAGKVGLSLVITNLEIPSSQNIIGINFNVICSQLSCLHDL